MIRRHHRSTLFPYTTLFRSKEIKKNLEKAFYWYQKAAEGNYISAQYNLSYLYKCGKGTEKNLEKAFYWYQKAAEGNRSEEHTSELQSLRHLVCRLLLEKKKK